MYLNTRSLLFTGIVLAGLLAGLGGFLFFAQMPDAGASREEIFASTPASRQIGSTDINRIIAERQALAPKPSSAATAQLVADGRMPLDNRRMAASVAADAFDAPGAAAPAAPASIEPGAEDDANGVIDEKPETRLPAKDKAKSVAKPAAKPMPGDRGEALDRKGDNKAALQAWREDAEAGDADAAYHLGMEYLTGRLGVIDRDAAEGARWLRFASDRGQAQAQLALGQLYESGEGVTVDKIEALKYYILADSSDGATGDRARRDRDAESPEDALRAGLSPEQVAEAERRAAAAPASAGR